MKSTKLIIILSFFVACWCLAAPDLSSVITNIPDLEGLKIDFESISIQDVMDRASESQPTIAALERTLIPPGDDRFDISLEPGQSKEFAMLAASTSQATKGGMAIYNDDNSRLTLQVQGIYFMQIYQGYYIYQFEFKLGAKSSAPKGETIQIVIGAYLFNSANQLLGGYERENVYVQIGGTPPPPPVISVTPDTLKFSVGGSLFSGLAPRQSLLPAADKKLLSLSGADLNSLAQNAKFLTASIYAGGSDDDTLGNTFEEPYSVFKDEYQTEYEATRLAPAQSCTLKTLLFAFWNYGTTRKSKDCEFFVWSDNSGRPGSQLKAMTATLTLDAEVSGWVALDISEFNLVVNGPFWIGHREKTSGAPSSLVDETATPGGNYYSTNGTSWQEDTFDYLQRVVVSYGGNQPPEDEAMAVMQIRNTGDSPLVVSGITTSVSWVKEISPRNFTLQPGANQDVQVRVSASGLNDGLYSGTLNIASNDPAKPSYPEPMFFTVNLSSEAPVADFMGTPMSGNVPLTVQFTDKSTGPVTSWQWDFGDGGTSSAKNPSHTYTNPGTYTVTLSVSGPGGSDVETKANYITVNQNVQVTADFDASPTSGQAPLTVQFTDKSTGPITTWLWDFGDGNAGSQQNPSHTYNQSGEFTVSLTVAGDGPSATETKENFIVVTGAQVVADFEASPRQGNAPLAVQFTDKSTGPITTWDWDFGDGGTSGDQNPRHTYVNPGVYSVVLEIQGPQGNAKELKTNYISVGTQTAPAISVTPDTLAFSVGGALLANLPDGGSTPASIAKALLFLKETNLNLPAQKTKFLAPSAYAASSDDDTLGNTFEPPFIVFKDEYQTEYEATRLVPAQRCTVKVLVFAFWNYDTSSKSKACEFYVWSDNNGRPGSKLMTGDGTVTLNADAAVWLGLDISELNLVVDGPFWIGHREKASGAPSSLADQTATPNGNYYSTNGTTWQADAFDYLQQAVVSYGESQPPDDEAVATMHIKNTGNAPLVVSGAASSASWVKEISPRNFTVSPGANQDVLVRVSANGLADGTYSGTLAISSNDPNTPSYTEPMVLYVNMSQEIVADFTANPTSGNAPLTAQFTDKSRGDITSFAWNFGDGGTSSAKNPSHRYDAPGAYTVSLTVAGLGGSDTETKTNYINVSQNVQLTADFSATPTSGQQPLKVQFTDKSTGPVTSWQWDFGDGNSNFQQNPSYTYADAGKYTVSLTVAGNGATATETKQDYIIVTQYPLSPKFEASPKEGVVPLTVQFNDQSEGKIVKWQWNFGDGNSSTQQNPKFVYSDSGQYDVTLTITDENGQSATAKIEKLITVHEKCVAKFEAGCPNDPAGFKWSFKDLSTGPITEWTWDYGDGATDKYGEKKDSIEHVYKERGVKTVTLTVKGKGGSSEQSVSISVDIGVRVQSLSDVIPTNFELKQNFPNPFNPVTTISFALPVQEHVVLEVYDALGQKVAELIDADIAPGEYKVIWDASTKTSGAYFYRLQAGKNIGLKKCLLIK